MSNNYGQYLPSFIKILSELKFVWDGHLVQISTCKHFIKLSDPNTTLTYSTPIWAGPKTREFERVEIDKMF